MATVFTGVKPKLSLSLFKQPDPEPVSIVHHLRTGFEYLNSTMFEQINKPELKELMTEISDKCLNSLGEVYSCDHPLTMKSSRATISNNFFIGLDHYLAKITGVHVYSCDGVVYKKTSFFINDTNCFFKLVLEICLQKYAATLDCGMKIPEIYDYILSQNGDYLSLEIKMEKIDLIENKVNQPKLLQNHASLISAIKSGLDCFERNGLYHNDTHSDNIGFYEEDGVVKVVLMDFGKATLTNKNRYQSPSGFYKEIEDEDKFKKWLLHTIQENTGRRTFYGGKRKRRLTKKRINRKSKYTNKHRGRR
jgi:serine/threonine protein kinase